jgi:hypothetical protein
MLGFMPEVYTWMDMYTWIVKLTMHILAVLHNCVSYLILIAEFERISRLEIQTILLLGDIPTRVGATPIGTSGFLLLLFTLLPAVVPTQLKDPAL